MSLRYNSKFPLARLEKGDRAIIKVNKIYDSFEDIPEREKKYLDVIDGTYEAIYKGDYELECKKQPLLNGKYCYRDGNKWGTSYGIFADEKIIEFDKFPKDIYEIKKESEEKHREILKGASIKVPWENKKIILKKLPAGWIHNELTNKTNAAKNKIKISKIPVYYQIQYFNFTIIPLYEILEGGDN